MDCFPENSVYPGLPALYPVPSSTRAMRFLAKLEEVLKRIVPNHPMLPRIIVNGTKHNIPRRRQILLGGELVQNAILNACHPLQSLIIAGGFSHELEQDCAL